MRVQIKHSFLFLQNFNKTNSKQIQLFDFSLTIVPYNSIVIKKQNRKEKITMTHNEAQIVNEIKSQYTEAEHNESKIEQLKRLHKKTTRGAQIYSYTHGIISSLVLGTGMCLAMGVIGSGTPLMVAGIAIGVVGLVLCGITYPIYKKMVEKAKKKNAEKIISLSDEILNNN